MSAGGIEIIPLAGSLGAEVRGVDLRRLDNQAWDAVHQAFLDYKVIAIRDQQLGPQDVMDVGGRFGEPNHYPFVKGLDGFPFLFDIVKEPTETVNFGGGWHSDTTYMKTPPLATLLYAIETPPRGGDTLYCDMVAAYESLSPGMKALLAPLKGVNSAGLKHVGGRKAHHATIAGMSITGTEEAETFEAVHPIVRTIAETGQKALYCSRGHTVRFDGMTEEESRPLLDWLQAHATRPEFTCRVAWKPGTLTVWDNRRTMHSAINDYQGLRRHMRRLTSGPTVPA
ncbi:MAG: TauD/TfdA family dioxygenase [Reyranellaceae bacterium]